MSNIFEFNRYRPGIHETAFIHPNAAVTGNVIIGRNVYAGPGAAIRGDCISLASFASYCLQSIPLFRLCPPGTCYLLSLKSLTYIKIEYACVCIKSHGMARA